MELNVISPALLAYVGDSVYELQVRTWLLNNGYRKLNEIHKNAVKYVNAKAQARGLNIIKSKLTDEEEQIVRRGRNSKSGSIPNNAEMMDYRLSTGLEALFGYHYLLGNHKRIAQLWELIVKGLEDE